MKNDKFIELMFFSAINVTCSPEYEILIGDFCIVNVKQNTSSPGNSLILSIIHLLFYSLSIYLISFHSYIYSFQFNFYLSNVVILFLIFVVVDFIYLFVFKILNLFFPG